MAGKADSVKTIFYALGANFAIFVAKLVAAILTPDRDLCWPRRCTRWPIAAIRGCCCLASSAPRRRHRRTSRWGFGKAIYFWSFLVALMLFSVGGMFSIYEGLHKLQHPEPLRWAWLAVGVLTFGIIAEALSMWGCLSEVNKARGSQSLWRWFRDSRQSELIVIFGEDLAALLGLAFALIAVLLTMVTGNPMYDAIGSIGIGVLLIVIAVFIAVEVKALLIGQGVEPRTKDAMLKFLGAREEIKQVYNLLTLQMGPDVMVAIKAEMSRYLAPRDMIEDINRVEQAFRAEFPDVRWCFFEPDSRD